MHVRRKISTSSVTGRRVSIHKSSSITGLNNLITPIVSEAHYTRDGSDSENDEREDPIEIAQLTRRLIRQGMLSAVHVVASPLSLYIVVASPLLS